MWKEDKIDYLRKNRDYSSLLETDDAEIPTPRSQGRGRTKEIDFDKDDESVSRERQEYLDRRRRLKELERQKLTHGKVGTHSNGAKQRRDSEDGTRARVVSSNRGDAGHEAIKEKKKLPYDRGFGSFFGPSEPVVAQRIIEEDRAREEAQIAAARQAKAKAREEAERKKPVSVSKVGKSTNLKQGGQRPHKPVNDTADRARQLKAARDYSFLFDESALPGTDLDRKTSAAVPQVGHVKDNRLVYQANTSTLRKPPVAPQRSSSVGQNASRPSLSSRPSETLVRSAQLLRTSSKEASRDQYASDKSAQNLSRGTSFSKQSSGLTSAAGIGRPDLKKDNTLSGQVVTGRHGLGVAKLNGTKNTSHSPVGKPISRSESGHRGLVLEKVHSDLAEKRLLQSTERLQLSLSNGRPLPSTIKRPTESRDQRPVQSTERRPVQSTERRPVQTTDRRPVQTTDRRPVQTTDRRPVQSTDRRPVQSTDRRPVQAADRRPVQAADRRPVQTVDRRPLQSTSRGLSQSSGNRPAGYSDPRVAQSAERRPTQVKDRSPVVARTIERQSIASRSTGQVASIKAPNGVGLQQRVPPLEKRKVTQSINAPRGPSRNDASMRYRGYGNSSEDDDDSFIDDDDAPQNVSSLIHSIMGYNPSKYRRNDDFDDRDMVAGFRTIEAEERRSAREGRLEDEREAILIEAEEKAERLRRAKKKRKHAER